MSVHTADPFQTREELVTFIEQQAGTAVEKALPARVERRVPWATSGPVGRDSAGYSMLKAAAYALGFVGPEQAKEEIHAHHQLRDLYASYGFLPHHGQQSFLVPLASAHLPAYEPQGRKLRDELRQKMSAQADRFDPDEADWIGRKLRRKALGLVAEEGAELVPNAMLGELIELQRSLEVFASAGAREIALPPNGRVSFPKLASASLAYWVGEGASITESQPSTGNLELTAKKLGVFVKLNNELLRFASPSAEGLVRFDMARAAALKADLAMLEGSGSTQIKGITTYSGITTHVAGTTGANGDTFTPADVAAMEALLPDAVEAPTAWVMRKAMFAALVNRRADAVSAADGKGPFLFRDTRSLGADRPSELFGTKVVRSAQVAANRTKGSASNLT